MTIPQNILDYVRYATGSPFADGHCAYMTDAQGNEYKLDRDHAGGRLSCRVCPPIPADYYTDDTSRQNWLKSFRFIALDKVPTGTWKLAD